MVRAFSAGILSACLAGLASGATASAAERFLERFPIVIDAGLAVSASDGEVAVLPDVPFDPERGYGYVGGQAKSRRTAVAFDGDPRWPLVWREDPASYSFHLRNGEYVVSLSFVETEVSVVGARVFDIVAEEERLWPRFDIFQEAGDFRWLTVESLVDVRDGWLDLRFEAAEGSLPPRVARLRIEPAETIVSTARALPTPALRARPGFLAVELEWDTDSRSNGPVAGERGPGDLGTVEGATGETAVGAGFGLFRSLSADGPFESLTDYPILVRRFVDRRVSPGNAYYYRVRSYGARGGQSRLSKPVVGAPLPGLPPGLPLYDIRLSPGSASKLGTRSIPPAIGDGQLIFQSSDYRIDIAARTELDEWQFKKSYRVDLRGGKELWDRKTLLLLADAGDATRMRQALFAACHRVVGVAAPTVRPVHLLLDRGYEGIYFDREHLDRRFRRRERLDSVGEFARLDGGARLRLDWSPYSEPIERRGSLWNLTLLVHELNRVEEGAADEYLEERLYLDRILDRLALAAIVGRNPGAVGSRIYLGDSRNGRWEFFADRPPEGAFGVTSFEKPRGGDAEPSAVIEWALFGPGLRGRTMPLSDWHRLETRLFDRPATWRRYLDRIDTIYRERLTPEVFSKLVDEAFAPIAGSYDLEPRLWPDDGGEQLRRAPADLKAHFDTHRRALLERVERERRREPEPLVVNEFLLKPPREASAQSTGSTRRDPLAGAWVEIANRSKNTIALDPYRLATDPGRPAAWAFPRRTLGAGEQLLLTLGPGTGPDHCNLRPNANGGVIVLSRVDSRGRATAADIVFYGYQTAGRSYGRTPGADDGWGFFAEGTPGKPNDGPALVAPPWRYSWSLETEKDGELTAWLRPIGQVESVELRYRPPGEVAFRSLPMRWDDRRYRYHARAPRFEGDPRVPFFFVARAESGIERAYPLTASDLPFYLPTRPKLFVNELLPRPLDENPHGEFVEIYNDGDAAVSIEGMFLTDDRDNPRKWRIPRKEPIPPKGFAVLYADGEARGIHAPFKLGNSGEYLGLYHRLEEGNILVDHVVFNAVPADQSWGRRRDGKKGGRFWKDPTPGKKNLPKIPEEYLRRRKAEGEPED